MAELRVGANLDVLSSIGAFVMDAAKEAGLNSRAAYRLRLAVDEMATNVIVHGKPLEHSGDDEIRLVSDIDEESLKITMEDRGPEFNPLARAVPDDHLAKPLEQRPIGGLGVFLAIRGVDHFHYERVGNTNRSIFTVNRASSESGR
jgi:anti-sigma regulatory factor (Ser/Thr protein kinase)